MKNKKKWMFGDELDKILKKDLKGTDEGRQKEFRQATTGRLAEMGLIEWTIANKEGKFATKEYGKSCFKIPEAKVK